MAEPTTYQMGVTINSDWKVEVVDPPDWKGQILECPGKIKNGLPQGQTSQVMVDTAKLAVVSLVSNPQAEVQQQRRDDRESRIHLVGTVVNQLGPYADFAQTAYQHFNATPAEAEAEIKSYLADKSRYTVSNATEEYGFTLDIDPPDAQYRHGDDTQDNWTIGGFITEWTPEGYAASLRIVHFGPTTAQY